MPHNVDMSIIEHLKELRRRIIISLVLIFIGVSVAFYFSSWILQIVLKPYGAGFHPVVLDPTERIMNYFKVALAGGLVLSSPFVIGQLMAFLAPGILPRERRYIFPVLPVIVLLFAIGTAFGYYLVLPTALKYLMNLGGDFISNQIRLDSAVSFVVQICLICGLIFQLPVVIFLLAKVGLVTASFLKRQRKLAIIMCFIIAAIITPTQDPVTMTLVAVPLLLLYEVSILVAKVSNPAVKQIKEKDSQSDD